MECECSCCQEAACRQPGNDGISAAQDTVGTLRLALARLQAALAPAPQRLLAELHKRLPALAAVRYERMSESIHSATAWLRQRPASTEEAVERLAFLVKLQVKYRRLAVVMQSLLCITNTCAG